jgi:hypothetical protein
MRLGRRVLGAVLVAAGAVWFFQGLGLIHGSFMTGQTRWTAIGVVVALAGFVLLGWPGRSHD